MIFFRRRRAKRLLMSLLSEVQKCQFSKRGYFVEKASDGSRWIFICKRFRIIQVYVNDTGIVWCQRGVDSFVGKPTSPHLGYPPEDCLATVLLEFRSNYGRLCYNLCQTWITKWELRHLLKI